MVLLKAPVVMTAKFMEEDETVAVRPAGSRADTRALLGKTEIDI